jgi:molybdate transport system permease protein
VLDTLVDLPITIPPVVAGVALLLAFGRRGLLGRHLEVLGLSVAFTTVAVVMAQLLIASPFFVKAARAGFESVDARLEAAARTLGASPWRVFWTVTVPLARPALVSGIVPPGPAPSPVRRHDDVRRQLPRPPRHSPSP